MSYEPIHTEEFNGYTINIFPDLDAGNPWENEDGNPPIAIYADRNIHTYGEGNGDPNEAPALTRAQIKENLPAIKEMLANYEVKFSDVDDVNDTIREYVDDLGHSDRLEALETLFNMVGIPALLKSVHGSCQGDYAEVLAISTPAFEEEIGTKWTTKELEGSIQLYGDWAFGNVYGYTVEDKDGNQIDSCWGFYGDYDAIYGPVHEAEAAINWHIHTQHGQQLKQAEAWGAHCEASA